MEIDMDKFIGFRNLDPSGGTIAKALESQTLYNHGLNNERGLIALAVTGPSYTDEKVKQIANDLPEGQTLWAFSPTYRKIDNPRLKVTHVNAETAREFQLKVSHHLGKFVQSLPEGTPLSPARLPFPESAQSFASDEEYVPRLDRRMVATKYIDGVPFEFFSDLRSNSKKLVVFGQSAVTRGTTRLPYFFRWTWAHRIDASVMIWNDPTLYLGDDLDAGWWVGEPGRDYVAEGVSLIQKNMEALGIQNEDVIFIGLSAGGMSALPMASLLPGSQAIVENPRITMFADGAKGNFVQKALKACFGCESAHDVPESLRYRIDVIERIRHSGHLPRFIYLQNTLDEGHFGPHYMRFREEAEAHPDFDPARHKFVEYEQWSLLRGGHFPLKEAAMLRIIQSAVDGTDDLPPVLSKEQITLD